MKFTLFDLYAFSIGIPAIIGAVRFKKINPAYYPFIYLLWIGFVIEIISYFMIYSGHFNAIPYNIYSILEALMITLLFKNWRLFQHNRFLYYGLIFLFIGFWLIEAFIIKNITQSMTYFRIFYPFCIVIMTIYTISNILSQRMDMLGKNSTFLICLGFILYFTFTVFVGIFQLWGINATKEFRYALVMIPVYLNVITNLIYALAVLWMPSKLRFTMPF